jgi:hypothetical protein
LPNINWNDPILCTSRDYCSTLFSTFVSQFAFEQYVTENTRPNSKHPTSGSLLDIVLCNDPFAICDVAVSEPFSTSDHYSVSFNLNYTNNNFFDGTFKHVHYNFDSVDWNVVNSHLANIDWFHVFSTCVCIEDYSNSFYKIIYDCIHVNVPNSTSKGSHLNNKRLYPLSVRKLETKKRQAWRLYKAFHSESLFTKYKLISSKCRQAKLDATRKFEESIINSGNLGKFFRYANSKLATKHNVGPLRFSNGSITIDPSLKADLLSKYFDSVYTVDNDVLPTSATNHILDSDLSSISFNATIVSRCLKKLNVRAAGGPDNVPPVFLNKCCNNLAYPIAFIFQLFFENSFLPDVWRQAYITPVFKKGDATQVCNYRPISLTCTLCKLMESVIKDQLLSRLVSKGLINKHQHGFISKHSTITNLLECTHDWSLSFHSKLPVDVIYIDFSKAFDSVVHSKLLYKLRTIGINGLLLKWITAFLQGRSQCVVVENRYSSWSKVISGVPQGSVLGPLLFILFINDISNITVNGVFTKLYADDLKLYTTLISTDDSNNLQIVLSNLLVWSKDWQLEVNVSKSHVLHLHKNNPLMEYYFDGNLIESRDLVTDIGVDIDPVLHFDKHIDRIVAKAYSRIGLLFRGFVSRNLHVFRQAYITYIRPLLEYASNVWSPHLLMHINSIERVQRHFTKRITVLRDFSYRERLSILNLDTLEYRRLSCDLTLYYKIFNNLTPWSPIEYFNVCIPPYSLHSVYHDFYIRKPLCRTNSFENDFFNRCVNAWNSLPSSVINSKSIASFKHNLKSVDLSSFLNYVL